MYKIKEFAEISSISTRTLRYYDQINLLNPSFVNEAGYRFYDNKSVQKLQLILFYKEIGYSLNKIKSLLTSDEYDELKHLEQLKNDIIKTIETKKNVLDLVKRTINAKKAGIEMEDIEKFEAFKKNQIIKNEEKYGKELEKYDSNFVKQSYKKYQNRTKDEMNTHENFIKDMHIVMKQAMSTNDPQSKSAQKMCEMHKKWLMFYWPAYSKIAHLNLTKMYTEDKRFKTYYENIEPGLTDFLYEAMKIYLQ